MHSLLTSLFNAQLNSLILWCAQNMWVSCVVDGLPVVRHLFVHGSDEAKMIERFEKCKKTQHVHVAGFTMADAGTIKTLQVSNYYSEEIRDIVLTHCDPLLFPKACQQWPCSKWTPKSLADQLGIDQISFRICAKADSPFYKLPLNKVVTEPDCEYVKASLQNFCAWLEDDSQNAGELGNFPRAHYWCYADYKYMVDIFSELPLLRQGPLWSAFGFQEVTGDHSTIWIGSEGSNTPCHLDTYGCNLVAQIYGKKKWTLFPPSQSNKLCPTRIPYEESSIFSKVNIKCPDLSLSPDFNKAIKYEVVLEPGDVLLVPRHWWHYVESLEPSISTNTWITLESDHVDRVREAVTRTLVCSLKESEKEDQNLWLNPTEEAAPHTQNMEYIRQAAMTFFQNQGGGPQCPALTNNDIIDCITAPEIVNQITSRLLAKTGDSTATNSISPFKIPGPPRSCRCECCGPVCIRSSVMPKRPMRSLSEPAGAEERSSGNDKIPQKRKRKS